MVSYNAVVSVMTKVSRVRHHDPSTSIPAEGAESTVEIDNHADTCCLGSNFIPLSFSGQVCSVSPFSDSYSAMQDVPVCTGATAWTDRDSGVTHILIVHEALWFGTALPNSLLNPNQCRAFGISLCDDPTDPFRSLGMRLDNLFIPFTMSGSTASFTTRAPTKHEIDLCNHIAITEDLWDPTQVHFDHVKAGTARHLSSISTPFGSNGFRRPASFRYESDAVLSSISTTLTDVSLYPALVRVSNTNTTSQSSRVDSNERHTTVTAESIAQSWAIGLESARMTLRATTQLAARHAIHPLRRRYRTDVLSTRHRRLNIRIYSDTLFSKTRSIRGNTCAQLFAAKDFVWIYPMKAKAQAGEALQCFIEEVGIPATIVVDGANEQVGPKSAFLKTSRTYRCDLRQTEAYSPWQNRAKAAIGEVKKRWKQQMTSKGIPKRLWDFGLVWQAEVLSRTARRSGDGRTGIERITGDTPDISEWTDFSFYDRVWAWDAPSGESNPVLGRWLGVSHRIGSGLCYWVVKQNAKILSRTTVQHVPDHDMKNEDVKERIKEFDEILHATLDDTNHHLPNDDAAPFHTKDVYPEDDQDMKFVSPEDYSVQHAREADDFTEEAYDGYLNAELILPHNNDMVKARVVKRARGDDGRPVGVRNQNPMIDTRVYEVEFMDGSRAKYSANTIAENMFAQVDSEGRQFLLIDEISDHKADQSALRIEQGFHVSKNGNRTPKRTTRGWKLLVQWRDGTSDWVPLKDLKDSNPVEVAEYAVSNGIDSEPAFHWWVKPTLRRRDRIVSKVKNRYWKITHKFGFELPHSVPEALAIDRKTGTDFWRTAIEKEMKNLRNAGTFETWDGTVEQALSGKKLVGYQQIECHMIFDIKMDGNFTRKARLVAGGHTTNTPASVTYSSVVTRDSVRIAFTIAALNNLDVFAADVGNAYLNVPCREKIWFTAGDEFGTDKGSVMLIRKALYGLKSSSAAWRAMLAQSLTDLGYVSSKADPDVWLRPQTKPDGFRYYEYVLVYVDDILHISHDTNPTMFALSKLYRLKEESMGPPTRYLGANIKWDQLPDGTQCWQMSGNDYVTNAVKNLEETLANENERLRAGGEKRPFPEKYKPELDVSELLDDRMVQRYQGLIGVLRWAVELGRVDIMLEVSLLSSYNAMPRVGHLEAVYHIFSYLKAHRNSQIELDPRLPSTDETQFQQVDWHDFYPEAADAIPPNMPEPLGNPVTVSAFVDANHAGNAVTRRSHTGILIFCNNAPVQWYSKRQNTVESSTFGSEFVALRICLELLEGLRYKLRMFGIPIDGPADVYCDNNSVVLSASVPTTMLNKKHNAICYHRVREAAAAGTIRVGKEGTDTNLADLFTKVLSTERRRQLLYHITY